MKKATSEYINFVVGELKKGKGLRFPTVAYYAEVEKIDAFQLFSSLRKRIREEELAGKNVDKLVSRLDGALGLKSVGRERPETKAHEREYHKKRGEQKNVKS